MKTTALKVDVIGPEKYTVCRRIRAFSARNFFEQAVAVKELIRPVYI